MKYLIMALLISVSAHAKVVDLTSPAQVKEELGKKGPMVVLYYTSWCGACKAYKPSFEKASNKFKDVRTFLCFFTEKTKTLFAIVHVSIKMANEKT
jgi:thiol-disulfide isomerase/thioredoxin